MSICKLVFRTLSGRALHFLDTEKVLRSQELVQLLGCGDEPGSSSHLEYVVRAPPPRVILDVCEGLR